MGQTVNVKWKVRPSHYLSFLYHLLFCRFPTKHQVNNQYDVLLEKQQYILLINQRRKSVLPIPKVTIMFSPLPIMVLLAACAVEFVFSQNLTVEGFFNISEVPLSTRCKKESSKLPRGHYADTRDSFMVHVAVLCMRYTMFGIY